jgi:hypothetical protein
MKETAMKKNPTNPDAQSGSFNPRVLLTSAFCAIGVFLAALGFASTSSTPGWSLVSSPSNGNTNSLYATTCTSPSDCWAVGNYWAYPGGYPYPQTLTEHWNGSSWSIVSSPNSSGTENNSLSGLACTSASNCWAVGSYTYYDNGFPFPSPHTQALIEYWDGAAWSIVASPNINPLSAVACASASDCWAVGSDIARWNGNSWSTYGSGGSLKSITCLSGSDCWAVGNALIEHWNGSSWVVVPEPRENYEANPDYLAAVSCASSSDCWAVGTVVTGEETSETLTEHWNGSSWSIVYSPSPSAESSSFNSVNCRSASNCWAVGSYFDGTSTQTLTGHWDGAFWTIVGSPSPSSRQNRLYSVTCPSSSFCWAVGDELNASGADLTLFEAYSPAIPPLTSVASMKIHGGTTYNVDLLGTSSAVECRNPGATGTSGVDYKIVFTFANSVTNCGSTNTGLLTSGPAANQCTVNLLSVANQQSITAILSNVLDSQNNAGSVSATMGVLIGDVNGNGNVSNTDVAAVKSQVAAPVTSSNFRNDVNANGVISNTDVSGAKTQVGTTLP